MSGQILLRDNIRQLLDARGLTQAALSEFCQHEPPWISKILSGERDAAVKDLALIAAFFGLEISDLFRHGVTFQTERRKGSDRRKQDRRSGQERRQRGHVAVRLGPQDRAGPEEPLATAQDATRHRRRRARKPK